MNERTSTRPSFNSSPVILASFSFNNPLLRAYELIVVVSAVLKPVKWVPALLGIEFVYERIRERGGQAADAGQSNIVRLFGGGARFLPGGDGLPEMDPRPFGGRHPRRGHRPSLPGRSRRIRRQPNLVELGKRNPAYAIRR